MSSDLTDPTRHIRPAPALVEADLEPLLAEPFAQAWASAGQDDARAVRGRLMQRLAASRAAEAAMVTVRRAQVPRVPLVAGVLAQGLYRAPQGRALRAGEPLGARLFELAAGATLPAGALGGVDVPCHREWLVLQGRVRDAQRGIDLGPRDYHVVPAGAAAPDWTSEEGAQLFLRESDIPALPGDAAHTVRDSEAGWPAYADGVRRRVLWQRQGQAALLYLADPGALVPMHTHGHDEECLMVQGELFLDDVLLQAGDYQLAPAGSGHRITETDTGVVIYAHGDLDLQFVS